MVLLYMIITQAVNSVLIVSLNTSLNLNASNVSFLFTLATIPVSGPTVTTLTCVRTICVVAKCLQMTSTIPMFTFVNILWCQNYGRKMSTGLKWITSSVVNTVYSCQLPSISHLVTTLLFHLTQSGVGKHVLGLENPSKTPPIANQVICWPFRELRGVMHRLCLFH